MAPTPTADNPHRRLIVRLLLLVAGAFLFAFALVPLYNVFCEATGLNGKSGNTPDVVAEAGAAPAPQVDLSRKVRVDFTGTVMPGLPWDLRPLTFSLQVHPGELQHVVYLAHNRSPHAVTAQAIASITPGQAARDFEKIECFCFTRQTLAPGESREMPVAFIVKPALDRDVGHITLSYSIFNVDGQRPTQTQPPEVR